MQLPSRTFGAIFLLAGLAWQPAYAAAPEQISLPGPHVHPKSVTATKDGALFVGSFADGGIMKVQPGATEAEPWVKPGDFGTRSILGVLADESHVV